MFENFLILTIFCCFVNAIAQGQNGYYCQQVGGFYSCISCNEPSLVKLCEHLGQFFPPMADQKVQSIKDEQQQQIDLTPAAHHPAQQQHITFTFKCHPTNESRGEKAAVGGEAKAMPIGVVILLTVLGVLLVEAIVGFLVFLCISMRKGI